MSPERLRRIDRIFKESLEREPAERASFLDRACTGDDSLRKEVDSLIASHNRAGSFPGPPAVPSGTRFGPYEVIDVIGKGGMGEVYRAHDSRLKRDVALKVLPPSFAGDEDRLSRFKREAQALASLNHPNIATIFGIEESNGRHALVLELIDGSTLADRISRGSLPLDEALPIAMQIAEALEAAHERDIVHRDLKPANIKVRPDGAVKVLDFGLAKVLTSEGTDPSDAPTMLSRTADGLIVGTAPYMSPEQARAQPVDRRTDVWAFGCVLFEMLTGHRLIANGAVAEVLSEILKAEPNWSLLPADTPEGIRRLLRRCLQKERKDRLQHIGDGRIEISDALARPRSTNSEGPSQWNRRKTIVWMCLAALAATFAVALALSRAGFLSPHPLDTAVYRTSIVLPDGMHYAADQSPAGRFALSPNGRSLAFVAMDDATKKSTLWVRQLDTMMAQPLAGTEGAAFPFWSYDSRFIAFLAQGQLRTIEASGGSPYTVCPAELEATGAWNQDNVILFTPKGGSSLYRVSASGGEPPVPVTTLDAVNGDIQHWYPFFLPDGRHFLYSAVRSKAVGTAGPLAVQVGSLDPKETGKLLLQDGINAKYAEGYLIYLRGNTLMARAFDPIRLELQGEAVPLASRIQSAAGAVTATAGAFTVSTSGVLAYQSGLDVVQSQLAWFDREGKPLGKLGDAADYGDVSLSPDGKRAAVSVLDPALRTRDVWIYDVASGRRERLTTDPANEFSPTWSPDGTEIMFTRQGKSVDLYKTPADGSGLEELMVERSVGNFAVSWSGRYILYVVGGAAIGRSDLWFQPRFGDMKPVEFLATPAIENQGQLSPDARWIAYISNKSGPVEVYVSSFPVRGVEQIVSKARGMWPRWGRYGREIFYIAPDDTLTAVTVNGEASSFELGTVQPLFRVHPRPQVSLGQWPYDVSLDGRFLINTFVEETTSMPITLFVNWTAELKKK